VPKRGTYVRLRHGRSCFPLMILSSLFIIFACSSARAGTIAAVSPVHIATVSVFVSCVSPELPGLLSLPAVDFCDYCRIGESFAAAMLLYWFRMFERFMGSSKFVAFVFVTALLASTLQLGLLVSFPSIQRISPGPYPLIFAMLVLYYGTRSGCAVPVVGCLRACVCNVVCMYVCMYVCICVCAVSLLLAAKVPKSVPAYFRLLGLSVSDKTLTYLVCAQLMFSGGSESVLASFSGIVCGALYASDTFRLSAFRFPRACRNAAEKILLPFVASEAPGAREARQRQAQNAAQTQAEAQLQAALRTSMGGAQLGGPARGLAADPVAVENLVVGAYLLVRSVCIHSRVP
jgi:hypothetical protein